MNDKIVKLYHDSFEATLEDFIDEYKSGKVDAAWLTWRSKDKGEYYIKNNWFDERENAITIIGLLEHLKHQLLSENIYQDDKCFDR